MRFIVLDGLDAAGKDTHARMIKERYESIGERVIIRSHPTTDCIFGRKAKLALLGQGKKDRTKASFHYAMDVMNSIRKYYDQTDTLIFVRYICGAAYLPYPMAKSLYSFFHSILPDTEYKFFLDVRPEESIKRIQKRKEVEMFENISSLRRVREKALRLLDDWYIINTNQPIEKAQRDIHSVLNALDKKDQNETDSPLFLTKVNKFFGEGP